MGGPTVSRIRVLSARSVVVALFVFASVTAAPAVAGAQGSCERDEAWGKILVPEVLEVVELTNEHRASLGLGPLAQSRALTRAALWKAAHMAAYDYLEHDDPAPPVARTWDERVTDCGYPHGAGENIAYGYETPEAVMDGWLTSEGHRRNIERTSFTAIGVGVAVNDGTIYWAQVFGTQNDSGSDAHSAPAPTADDVQVTEDVAASLDLVANDTDADGDPLGVTSLTQPSSGQVTVDTDGTVRYRPAANFFGEDAFTYTVVDVFGYQASAQVTVTVEPVNDLPEAADDFGRVRAGRRVTIDVVANDHDVESSSLTITRIVSGPSRGFATVGADARSISYRARRGTGGRTDRIVYEVSDADGGVARAALVMTIRRAR